MYKNNKQMTITLALQHKIECKMYAATQMMETHYKEHMHSQKHVSVNMVLVNCENNPYFNLCIFVTIFF